MHGLELLLGGVLVATWLLHALYRAEGRVKHQAKVLLSMSIMKLLHVLSPS